MAQIDGKWIKDNTVKDNHIELGHDLPLKGTDFAGTGTVPILKVNNSDLVEFVTQPQFASAPVNNADLVNKAYVLDVMAGLRDPKDACKVASTGNTALSGLGAGAIVVDGITLADGDRVLLKDQTDPIENGIYTIGNIGVNAQYTRALDADTNEEVTQGMSTLIAEGTANARKMYVLTTAAPDVGVSALTFAQAPNPANFLVPKEYVYTLAVAGDLVSIDLPHGAELESVKVTPTGGPKQVYGVDYTVANTGPGGVTQVTWAGDLAGLVAIGDELQISYSYATA